MHDDVRNCRQTIKSIKPYCSRATWLPVCTALDKERFYWAIWRVLEIQDFKEIMKILPR